MTSEELRVSARHRFIASISEVCPSFSVCFPLLLDSLNCKSYLVTKNGIKHDGKEGEGKEQV